jgi:uncharacterized coiled-coil DUF342 family protein
MKSRPVSVNVTANGLAANQAQQTANQAVTSANEYKMAWDEANSETIAALDEAQKEFESNLAWAKSQIYEGQHQNDSAVASLRSDMESSWNSMSTVEESLYNSAITATSEVDSHLDSLRVQNSLSLADLHSTANSLHAVDESLHSNMDTIRGSLNDTRNSLATTTNDLANVKTSLVDTKTSLATATSEIANDLNNAKNSLAAVDNDLRNGVKQASNDLSVAKTSLEAAGNSLATATSELQRQTGQLSGSLSTANAKIEYNSNAIAEVKHTAEEISTTVSNIRVGGRNLLTNTRTLSDVWNNGTTETVDGFTAAKMTKTAGEWQDIFAWNGLTNIKPNTDYVLTFYAKASQQTQIYSYLYNIGTDTVYADGSTPNTLTTDYQRYVVHFHTMAMPAGRTVNCLPVRLMESGVTVWIYGLQLEEGNTATQWQPNPDDTDQAISKISQTADAIRADLTNTQNDVASVKVTASSLQSQITDNKNNISSVKQTANSLTTRMSNAEGNVSSLQQTATGLQSTVQSQSGKISQLQQDTDGISATVGGAAIDLIPNLDQQFVMGYGIPSTTWDGHNACLTLPNTAIKHDVITKYEVLPQTAGFALNIPWQAGKTYMQSIIFETDATINDSIQPQWTWFTGTHDVRNAILSKLGNNTYRLIGSYTPTQERANSGYLRVFDIFNFTDFVDVVTTGTYLKFRNPRIWCPDDNSLAQLKLTADGLTSKVADTQGNVSKLEQTASGLQTQITNTKDDVASVKVTADSLTTQIADANGNISQLQQTAKGLQSTVTDQSDKISQLQQDADGLSATVGGAAIDVIPNLDQQFVMGFGIPNTTWDGHNACVTLPTTSIGNEVLPQDGTKFATFYNWEAGKTYMQSIIFETDAKVTDGMLWTWYTANCHMLEKTTLVKLGNNTYRLIGSHTPTASEAANPLRVFDIINFTAVVDVTTGTYLKFRNPRIWCPDDNSLAQLKLTADGLTSKVADTQGNVSSLQQTASMMQKQITDNKGNISSVKNTADEVRTDLTNAKDDIASVKAKADSLTSSMANANNQISTLQQRADSITSTLSNGGRNLLSNTREINDPSIWGNLWAWNKGDFYTDGINKCQIVQNSTQQWNGLKQYVFVEAGKKYTFSIDAKSGDNSNHTANFYITLNGAQEGPYNKADAIGDGQTLNYTPTWTRYSFTITATSNGYVAPRIERGTNTNELLQLARPQFECGETATPWQPSNGDISSLQQTAEGLTADMKDAKGNISSLQVTASQFTTRLHDAEDNVSSLQLTSKELDTQIKGVDGRATSIKETADGIDARVSKIEGNNVVGSLLKLDGSEAGLGTYVNNKLIAGINTNPDGVTIDGKNIHLNGQTHIDDGIINASKITVYNTVGDNKGDQYLAIAWGQLNSTIGGKDDQGNTLWGSINQTNSKLTSYYQELKNDGSSTRSLIQQTSKDILLAVDQKVKYKTYTVSASSPWDFNYTKSTYENWFINGDTSGNYFYNGPDGLKPWVYVQSRGSADGTRFVVTVWRDYDPTQYQRTWTGDHWTPWVMLPNSSNLVSAINLSPDGVTIDGKNIELNGNTTIHGQLNLLPTDQRYVDQRVQGFHNPWAWQDANVFAGSGGLQLQSTIVSQSYSNDNTPIYGLRGGSSAAITTLAPTYLKFTVYPSWNDVANNFSNQLCRTYIDAGRIETNDVQAGNFRLIGSKMQALDDNSLYVANSRGTNFDGKGDSVGFQVWAGIGLGQNTIYTPSNDLYIQQGNVGPGLGASYSSASKVDVHCNRVVSQAANTVSSRLSVKTAITKVAYDRALMAVQNTDMYDYRYTTDDTGQHYVSGIIDDIHDNPEYNMDPMLINKERTARIDANLLGYHQVVLQEILKRLDRLEAK